MRENRGFEPHGGRQKKKRCERERERDREREVKENRTQISLPKQNFLSPSLSLLVLVAGGLSAVLSPPFSWFYYFASYPV